MMVVFGLKDCEGDAGLVVKDVISPLWFATGVKLAANDDPTLGEINLFTNLIHQVPLIASREGGRDEFRANVALAEVFFCGVRH
jgi:hypothetical protein